MIIAFLSRLSRAFGHVLIPVPSSFSLTGSSPPPALPFLLPCSCLTVILESDGDILRFAGDAFMAVWTCDVASESMCIKTVVEAAREIQRRVENYQSREGVVLKLKIGISVGPFSIQHIGDSKCKHFVATGPAIRDVSTAQEQASSGQIVISPACGEAVAHLSLEQLPSFFIIVHLVRQKRSSSIFRRASGADIDASHFKVRSDTIDSATGSGCLPFLTSRFRWMLVKMGFISQQVSITERESNFSLDVAPKVSSAAAGGGDGQGGKGG